MGRDARTAAEGRLMFVHRCERLEALVWVEQAGKQALAWDELESLILAQNERWRHA